MRESKKMIIANWKMNPIFLKDVHAIFDSIKKASSGLKKTLIVICPSFVHIGELKRKISGGGCVLGAQDTFYEKQGAHTGEVSAAMLVQFGVKYVIIGHSERRAAGETDDIISKKILAAIKHGLIPVLCIGEKERDADAQYLNHIKAQVRESLKGVPKNKIAGIVIAYEPVWAIGSDGGKSDTPENTLETVLFIRKVLAELIGSINALAVPILYGGSVNRKNTEGFLKRGGVQGLLVGGASLNGKHFCDIINIADKIRE